MLAKFCRQTHTPDPSCLGRFHTHQMPDVFHEAADELGFLTQPEFAMCSVYPTPFAPMVVSDAVHNMFNSSFASIVHRRQHHPSVFGYTLSNEISWGGPGDAQFVELYHFAHTDQVELHAAGEEPKEKHILFPDGTLRVIHADGREEDIPAVDRL